MANAIFQMGNGERYTTLAELEVALIKRLAAVRRARQEAAAAAAASFSSVATPTAAFSTVATEADIAAARHDAELVDYRAQFAILRDEDAR